ncbi:hypothetical protein TIFTF001_040411, partial [Ficus carica]
MLAPSPMGDLPDWSFSLQTSAVDGGGGDQRGGHLWRRGCRSHMEDTGAAPDGGGDGGEVDEAAARGCVGARERK